jgi:predicted DCC family thiol-disulfide oxidoreductase YuxK
MSRAMLLYDRDCGFCRWSLAKVLAWDRRRAVRPVALDSPEAEQALAGIPAGERMASWHLREATGEIHSAGAGFVPLFRLLPGGSPLAALAARAPTATDRAYRWVAGHRSLWGKLVTERAKRRADERIAERLRDQDPARGRRPA